MKILDCTPVMTKTFLARIVESILKDEFVKKGDEERLREQIGQNLGELANEDRIINAIRELEVHRAMI